MQALITDDVNDICSRKLNLHNIRTSTIPAKIDKKALTDIINDFDFLILRSSMTITPDIIDAGRNLKIIARAGIGVDNVDVKYASKNDIIVMNVPDAATSSVSELVMCYMINLSRKVIEADKSMSLEKWEKSKFLGTQLLGKTLGIIGLGRIGTDVARKASAYNMKILAYEPYNIANAWLVNAELVPLERLLADSDYITLHTPGLEKSMINWNEFSLMKKKPYIINLARGSLINETGLINALLEGRISGAAIDVFEKEPYSGKLIELKNKGHNLLLTPHIGASSSETQTITAERIADQIISFVNEGIVLNAVNYDPRLKLYTKLADRLSRLAADIFTGAADRINIAYFGEVGNLNDMSRITNAILTNVNSKICNDENCGSLEGYSNMIQLSLFYNAEQFSMSGALSNNTYPKLLAINDFHIDIELNGHMFFLMYDSKPAVFGKFGAVLGRHDINIENLRIIDDDKGKKALAAMKLNKPVPDNVLAEVESVIRKNVNLYLAKRIDFL